MHELVHYLQNNNVVFFICVAVLAQQILLICDTTITSIIYPIVNRIFFNNKLTEYFNYQPSTNEQINNDIYISIYGIHFNISKLIFVTIRLVIIVLLLKFLYYKYS